MKHFRKTLNVKWTLILLGCVALLGTGVHFLHGFQVRRNASMLLFLADKAEQAGELQKAAEYASRYLGLVPTDPEGAAKLGLLLANPVLAKTPRAVERAYLKLGDALRLDPSREDIRRRAVDMALHPMVQRPWDALEHLAKLPVDKDADLLSLRGRCHESLREFPQARADYEAIIQLPEADCAHYLRLATLLRRHGAAAASKATSNSAQKKNAPDIHLEADQTIAQMLKRHDKSHRSHLFAAAYFKEFLARTDPKTAGELVAEHIRRALKLAPNEVDVQLAFAELEQENNNTDSARKVLEKGLKQHPDDWRLYQARARLEVLDRKNETALTVLRDGIKKLPNQIDLQWNLALLLAHQGKDQEAKDAIVRLAKQGFPQPELDFLEAHIHVAHERWLQAARLLEGAHPHLLTRADQQRDWLAISLLLECNLLLARCSEQLGDPDAAASAYSRVVTRFPLSASGRLGLARMEWHLGRFDNALREYSMLMQLSQAPAIAWIEAAQVHIVRNLQQQQADWPAVERLLQQAEKFKPVPVEVGLLRAEVLVAQQEFDKARSMLEQGQPEKQSRPVEVWVGIANLEQRRGRADVALALLEEAEKLCGDRVELRLARARYWSRRGGAEAPRALDHLSQGIDRFKPEEQRRLLPTLAESYLNIGEEKRAEAMWRQVAQRRSSDLGSRMALFDLALREGSDQATAALVQEIREIEGEAGTLWRYCKACQLIAKHQKDRDASVLKQASELLSAVASRRSNWARVPLAQAQVSDLLEHFDAAIAKYREAIQLGVESPAVIRRAVTLLSNRGRFMEMDELIQKLRVQPGAMADLDRVRAEIALWKQDPQQALALAEKAVPPNSKDFRDQIWLGHVKWAAGKDTEAEAQFRLALKLAPEIPDTWVTLVFHLVRTGAKARAVQVIEEAQKTLSKERATLAMAQCYETVGDSKRAEQLYMNALASGPKDANALKHMAYFYLRKGEPKEAQQYLERIISLKSLTPNQLADANRALALVRASSGDYRQALKALEQLGGTEGDAATKQGAAGESIADLRAKVIILAAAQNPRQRRQAIDILEELLRRRQQLTSQDHFLLAQLYESVNEWPKAREQFLYVLNATQEMVNKNSQAKSALLKRYADELSAFCAAMIRFDSINQSDIWLAKLESIEPKSFRSLRLRAQLSKKQGNAEVAVPELLALVKSDDKYLLPVALLLEQLGQTNAADNLFKAHVAKSKLPEAVLAHAEFYGRQNRPAEALALCQSASKSCRVEQVSSSMVMIAYAAKCSAEQHRQVANWLEAALANHPKSSELLTHLAAVRRLQQDFPGVIALFRRVIENDPNDTLTLNNLAWLVALSERNGTDALQLIQRAIALDGPQAEFLDTRAVVHLIMGDADKALTDLKEAIAERPTAHRYFHMAQAYRLAQNRSAAKDAWQQGMRLNLSESSVDPLELAAFQQLRRELDLKAALAR